MVRAKTKTRRLTRIDLREDIFHGSQKLRVDRDAGVIFGVKVVGRSSPNTHGVQGVEGTDYTLEALEQSLPLYEGINVNVDHPPRTSPHKERSAYDRFAWLENVAVQESGSYGDLHFLDPKDPLAIKMMTAAESKPDAFALSHNAVGKGEVKNKRYVIHEIPEVRSVDIVADGGTNRSLFESRSMKSKTTLRKIILESKSLTPATRKRLLEMGDKYCKESMDDEKEVDGAMEADDEPSAHDHMTNAIGSLVKSEDPDDHDKASKVLKLMKPKDVEEDDEGDDPEEEDEGESEEGRGKPTKGKGEENSKDDDKGKENMESRQRKAKKRCELAGVEPSADLLESLARVPSQNWDGIILSIKKAGGGNTNTRNSKSTPRSAPAGSVDVRESRDPGDGSKTKSWASRLLSRN